MESSLDIFYAKLMFKSNTSKRMRVYNKLASLLRNDFTLMEALSRVERIESFEGRKPNEPFAIVMRAWQKNLERGYSFSEATRGWVPTNETMLLTLGDVSKLSVALSNIERITDGTQKIKRAMLSAVTYPLFLFALTFGIIIMVGLYLVPPLTQAAGSDIVWNGVASSLVFVADISKTYWPYLLIGFILIVFFMWYSLPRWSGKIRTRFDNFPPWNMYKIQTSVGWLMSLSSLVASGASLPSAMRMLMENSNDYIKNILGDTLNNISNGDNLGVALARTGYNFPNAEIIGDLSIYADMNEFDENLSKIANDYLNDSVRRMESIASTLNTVGILLVSVMIGWVVFGTFEMQDQITSALS